MEYERDWIDVDTALFVLSSNLAEYCVHAVDAYPYGDFITILGEANELVMTMVYFTIYTGRLDEFRILLRDSYVRHNDISNTNRIIEAIITQCGSNNPTDFLSCMRDLEFI